MLSSRDELLFPAFSQPSSVLLLQSIYYVTSALLPPGVIMDIFNSVAEYLRTMSEEQVRDIDHKTLMTVITHLERIIGALPDQNQASGETVVALSRNLSADATTCGNRGRGMSEAGEVEG